ESREVLIVRDGIYRAAFIDGQDGQGRQVSQERAQAYLAIVEDRVRRIHNAVGGLYISQQIEQQLLGELVLEVGGQGAGGGHQVGGGTGQPFALGQVTLNKKLATALDTEKLQVLLCQRQGFRFTVRCHLHVRPGLHGHKLGERITLDRQGDQKMF